jgi:putative endonuclease
MEKDVGLVRASPDNYRGRVNSSSLLSPTKMEGWVYIIKSQKNGKYYVGSSGDPVRRLNEFHNRGKVKATRHLIPWKLVFTQKYVDISEARRVEHRFKMFKSRILLEKIISFGRYNTRVS